MFNALKYIKSLEEVGFPRDQEEVQVQIQEIAHQFTQFEYRVVTKLGVIVVTTTSLAVALTTWLMKLH